MMVVSRLLPWSSSQCQYPDCKSTIDRTLAVDISGRTSSIVGNGYNSRCRTLFSGLGSMHTLSDTSCIVWTEIQLHRSVGSTIVVLAISVVQFESNLKQS